MEINKQMLILKIMTMEVGKGVLLEIVLLVKEELLTGILLVDKHILEEQINLFKL